MLSEQQNDPANSLGVFILWNEAALHVKTDVWLKSVSCQEKGNWRVEQESACHYL